MIGVVLQDEKCNEISTLVQDPQGVIAHSLPNPEDSSFVCVRFIDPYGDTVFNPLQASALLVEWDRLKPAFVEQDAEALWTDIRKLILRCIDEPHTYIKFIGD